MTGWKIIEDPSCMAIILRHPEGARAYFSESRVGEVLMRERLPRLPENPFEALAWLIQQGLRPYKIEGDVTVFASTGATTIGAPMRRLN